MTTCTQTRDVVHGDPQLARDAMKPPEMFTAKIMGKQYTIEARVPRRCIRAMNCFLGEYTGCNPNFKTPYELGRLAWRIKDIIFTTGHPADRRKFEDLRKLNPGLFSVCEIQGEGGHHYNVFTINIEGQATLF